MGSGGYCDCGDAEAFLKHPTCSKHDRSKDAKANQTKTGKEIIESMPKDVVKRARKLMHEV